MAQYKDALGNFIDTPDGRAHKTASVNPTVAAKADSPSGATGAGTGAPASMIQIQSNGNYFCTVSNPS